MKLCPCAIVKLEEYMTTTWAKMVTNKFHKNRLSSLRHCMTRLQEDQDMVIESYMIREIYNDFIGLLNIYKDACNDELTFLNDELGSLPIVTINILDYKLDPSTGIWEKSYDRWFQ